MTHTTHTRALEFIRKLNNAGYVINEGMVDRFTEFAEREITLTHSSLQGEIARLKAIEHNYNALINDIKAMRKVLGIN